MKKLCAPCARRGGVPVDAVFERYARPGVCDTCDRTDLVCYVGATAPGPMYRAPMPEAELEDLRARHHARMTGGRK